VEFINGILWPTWICIAALAIYILKIGKLNGWEYIIPIILVMNVVSDLGSNYMQLGTNIPCYTRMKIETGFIYNVLAPSERILTLILYTKNSRFRTDKFRYYIGIVLIVLISIISLFYYPNFREMHRGAYVWGGLVVALLSYLHLRSIALDEAGQSQIMFAFSLANLVYFTLMISANSAVDLAYELNVEFGKNIYLINDIAFALWSIILIIGILWKRKT